MYFPLGYILNRGTTLPRNIDFRGMNFNEIEFRSSINNQTDNSKFLINFLHAWFWWEIISYFLDFQIYLFTIIYSRVTFIHQRGDLCEIIIFSFTVCVQFWASVYMSKPVKWQRKYHYILFIYVLSKGFISNSVEVVIFDFYPRGMYNRGVTFLEQVLYVTLNPQKSFSLRRRRSENDFF